MFKIIFLFLFVFYFLPAYFHGAHHLRIICAFSWKFFLSWSSFIFKIEWICHSIIFISFWVIVLNFFYRSYSLSWHTPSHQNNPSSQISEAEFQYTFFTSHYSSEKWLICRQHIQVPWHNIKLDKLLNAQTLLVDLLYNDLDLNRLTNLLNLSVHSNDEELKVK